jgi:hypothetical protein
MQEINMSNFVQITENEVHMYAKLEHMNMHECL